MYRWIRYDRISSIQIYKLRAPNCFSNKVLPLDYTYIDWRKFSIGNAPEKAYWYFPSVYMYISTLRCSYRWREKIKRRSVILPLWWKRRGCLASQHIPHSWEFFMRGRAIGASVSSRHSWVTGILVRLSSSSEDVLNPYVFPLTIMLVKGVKLALTPSYLGSLYAWHQRVLGQHDQVCGGMI